MGGGLGKPYNPPPTKTLSAQRACGLKSVLDSVAQAVNLIWPDLPSLAETLAILQGSACSANPLQIPPNPPGEMNEHAPRLVFSWHLVPDSTASPLLNLMPDVAVVRTCAVAGILPVMAGARAPQLSHHRRELFFAESITIYVTAPRAESGRNTGGEMWGALRCTMSTPRCPTSSPKRC